VARATAEFDVPKSIAHQFCLETVFADTRTAGNFAGAILAETSTAAFEQAER
jgi:hypothetical protein